MDKIRSAAELDFNPRLSDEDVNAGEDGTGAAMGMEGTRGPSLWSDMPTYRSLPTGVEDGSFQDLTMEEDQELREGQFAFGVSRDPESHDAQWVKAAGVKAVEAMLGATGAKAFGEAFAGVGVLLKTLADLAEANHYNNKSFQYLKTRCLANRETLWDLQRRLPYSEGSFQLLKHLLQ